MTVLFAPTHPKAVMPVRSTDGAAGFDLFATEALDLEPGRIYDIDTKVACVIPKGWVGIIRSRSGLWFRQRMSVFHGTIDADFRGTIKVSCKVEWSGDTVHIREGHAFAQMVVTPYMGAALQITPEELATYQTARGEKGLGSTDKQPVNPEAERDR